MRILFIAVMFLAAVSAERLCAQGESAVPFLLITASPASNGMGQVSAGLPVNDPQAAFDNPAQLGFQSLNSYGAYSYNRTDWLPQFQQINLFIRNYAVQAGINLRSINPAMPDFAIGLARSQMYLSLGTFQITNGSPTPIGSFDAFEQSDMSTIGFALKFGVTISAGLTHKNIISELAPINVQGQGRFGFARVAAYDYGFLVEAPLVDLVDRVGIHLGISKNISPVLNLSSGFSKNNVGDARVVYLDAVQADPLPRYARVGVGVQVGLNFELPNRDQWKIISFSWTAEANDMLVRRYPVQVDSNGVEIAAPRSWDYRDGFGDIQFNNELIAGHLNDEDIRKRGWQLSFANIIFIRGGRFEESPNRGNRHFNTNGLEVRTGGVWKMLRAGGFIGEDPSWIVKVLEHINLSYTHAEWMTDDGQSPLSGTTQDGWMISIVQ